MLSKLINPKISINRLEVACGDAVSELYVSGFAAYAPTKAQS